VLHLQTRVHLKEVEAHAGRVCAADDEFDRARTVVADGLRQRDGLLAHGFAHFGRDERRGRLLDDLLVAALDRAFALAEVEHIAVLVAEHLDLDVARLDDELLDEHAVVAEARKPLALGRLEALAHVLLGVSEAHTLAAAAGRGLHHHRIADFVRNADGVLGVLDLADEAGDDVDTCRLGELLRFDLVAHRGDGIGRRADEGDVLFGELLREPFTLREETVAGVYRFGAGRLAGRDDRVAEQVGFGGGRRAEPHGLVRHLHVQRTGVCIRIDRDRLDTHAPRRLDDTAGDLAAVRDQDFFEHERRRPPKPMTRTFKR